MSSANTVRSSWIAGEEDCLVSNERRSEISARAVALRSALTWSNVTTAHTKSSPTNPVATGIAQSAIAGRATSGSPKGRRRFYRFPIVTSYSPCHENWRQWHFFENPGHPLSRPPLVLASACWVTPG